MTFNFPNNPADGTVYAPVGGPVYVWHGGVWTAAVAESPASVDAFTIRSDAVYPSVSSAISSGLTTNRWANTITNILTLPNNVSNPTTIASHGQFYLNGTTLQFKFPSGTIKTVATDP